MRNYLSTKDIPVQWEQIVSTWELNKIKSLFKLAYFARNYSLKANCFTSLSTTKLIAGTDLGLRHGSLFEVHPIYIYVFDFGECKVCASFSTHSVLIMPCNSVELLKENCFRLSFNISDKFNVDTEFVSTVCGSE